jgi:hypothetical protein
VTNDKFHLPVDLFATRGSRLQIAVATINEPRQSLIRGYCSVPRVKHERMTYLLRAQRALFTTHANTRVLNHNRAATRVNDRRDSERRYRPPTLRPPPNTGTPRRNGITAPTASQRHATASLRNTQLTQIQTSQRNCVYDPPPASRGSSQNNLRRGAERVRNEKDITRARGCA